ncbi:MAG: hypothetical protein JWP82_3280 [Humibacillus sp.]|nr:hypothetical protein [Humibacillus sp.]
MDELISRMRALQDELPSGDGVRAFNGMYLTVTELVRDRLVSGGFADSAFMTRLDLVFAGLYLEAAGSVSSDPSTSPVALVAAWAPLVDRRAATGVLPIQFALAGMNAHINHDLPIAVVRACRQLGLDLDTAGVEADYQAITGLLASVQEQVRRSFLDGVALEVDQAYAAPIADLVGSWSIGRARDAAWANARVLWEIRDVEPVCTDFLFALSSTVGMVSTHLLTPVVGPG